MHEHGARPQEAVSAQLSVEFRGGGEDPVRAFVTGQIDYGNASTLGNEVTAGRKRLVGCDLILDLGGVDFMDSSGVRTLLELDADRRKQGCVLVLCSLTKPVQGLLAITGVSKHLKIADGPEEAAGLIGAARSAEGEED